MSAKQKFIDLVLRGKDLFSPSAKAASTELDNLKTEAKQASDEFKSLQTTQEKLLKARGLELYAEQAEKALAGAREEVTRLAREIDTNKNSTKALADNFSEAKKTANAAEKALAAASKEVTKLSKEMDGSGGATKAQSESLDAARNSAKQAETALQAAREEVTRLASEMKDSGGSTKEQTENLSAARRSANQLQTEYNKLTGQLSRSKTELKQAGVNTDRLADEQNRLQKEIKQSATALSDKRTKLRAVRGDLKETEKATDSFGNKLSNVTKGVIGFVAAYVGLSKIRDGLVSILTTGDQLESYSFQFAALMGSIEKGEQATAWVEEFAQNTGTRLSNVRDAFVKLKTFGLDPMNGSLQSLVDYNAKLGGSQEKLEGIILAVGQAWGKQKLQGEEILQLVERGIPVWELLATATGKSVAELQKLSAAGKLGRDSIQALVNELGKVSSGAAQSALDRLGGQVNIIANNWERFKQLISDSGLYQAAVDLLADINAQFTEMASNGQLEKAAKDISNFFTSLIQNGGTQLKDVVANINSFITAINIVSGAVQLAFNSVTAGINTVAAVFTRNLGGMVAAYGKFLDIIGANDAAKSLQNTANFLKELSSSYVDAIEQDSKDMADAWARFTNTVHVDTSASFTSATNTVVAETEKQKAAIDNVSAAEQARAQKQAELAQLMAQSNITTLDSLKALEAAAKETYEKVNEGVEQGITSSYEAEQAFNAWATASLKLAGASKAAVPEVLRLAAAKQGLGLQLDDLIRKQGLSIEYTDQQGRSVSVLRSEIQKTQDAIALYQGVIASETATLEEKRLATLRLVDAQQLLKGQIETLAEVEALRTKTYFEVKQALELAKRETEQLTQAYEAGSISTQQYNDQLERQTFLVRALQGMLVGTGAETERHGQQQTKTAQEVSKTTEAVETQSVALEGLSGSTQKATQYSSYLAAAQQYLRKEFDFTNSSTEELGARYEELSGFISQNRRAHNEWWREVARASNEAFTREQQIIKETLAVRQYTDQLNSGGVTMDQVRRIANTLNFEFNELSGNELAPLRNAITDAERRILSLRDNLSGTVSSLRDELDRLNNDQAAIEQRRYETQLAELQEKLKAAQASGDQQAVAAAQEALRLAKEIYAIKTAQFNAEKQVQPTNSQQGNNAAAKQTNTRPALSSSSTTVPSAPQDITKTVRVELALPSGKVVGTQATAADASVLMAELERIRSTSL